MKPWRIFRGRESLGALNRFEKAEVKLAALRLQGQYSKDLIQWLQLICATPGARARIGMKGTGTKKAMGPLAAILAAKQGRRA